MEPVRVGKLESEVSSCKKLYATWNLQALPAGTTSSAEPSVAEGTLGR